MMLARVNSRISNYYLNFVNIQKLSSNCVKFFRDVRPNQQLLISNNYLKSKNMKSVKIISHRGRCDIFPQNTVQSISEALITSDLAEFDVMLTKDNEVIVFHDRFLGQLTNISQLPQFKDRQTIDDLNQYGQIPHAEWWVKQFTLEEIQKLVVRQKHPTRPQIMEKQFRIPTLDEILKKALQVKSTQQKSNASGLLIQIKTQRQNFKSNARDLVLLQKINSCLKSQGLDTRQKCESKNLPIIIQTFNQQSLQTFNSLNPNMPLVHLYSDQDENVCEQYLAEQRTPQSLGVAISTKHLTRQFIEICRKLKYEVFYWSVMDDKPEIPFGCASYEECYQSLRHLNVDGIITDFAGNCKNALTFAV